MLGEMAMNKKAPLSILDITMANNIKRNKQQSIQQTNKTTNLNEFANIVASSAIGSSLMLAAIVVFKFVA